MTIETTNKTISKNKGTQNKGRRKLMLHGARLLPLVKVQMRCWNRNVQLQPSSHENEDSETRRIAIRMNRYRRLARITPHSKNSIDQATRE
jgi:hypothetical protein